MSFAEIVKGRDASVRMTDDGYLYAVDLVMVMTGLARDQSGLALRRLSDENSHSINLIERHLSTHGGPKTKLVGLRDAIQLVMVLPGKVAKETRAQFAGIIERYLAGDQSLHAEIEGNASSNSPIAQLARHSLGIEKEDAATLGFKRRREELELLKMEEEIKAMAQTRILTAGAELERYRDPKRSNLDERTRLMLQDSLQNSILNTPFTCGTSAKAITDGKVSPNKPISIASVAKELGYNPNTNESKSIGVDLRKRYIKEHGKPPPKHDQLCDGRVTLVNSYTEQDRALVVAALHAYFRQSEESGEDEDGE